MLKRIALTRPNKMGILKLLYYTYSNVFDSKIRNIQMKKGAKVQ